MSITFFLTYLLNIPNKWGLSRVHGLFKGFRATQDKSLIEESHCTVFIMFKYFWNCFTMVKSFTSKITPLPMTSDIKKKREKVMGFVCYCGVCLFCCLQWVDCIQGLLHDWYIQPWMLFKKIIKIRRELPESIYNYRTRLLEKSLLRSLATEYRNHAEYTQCCTFIDL